MLNTDSELADQYIQGLLIPRFTLLTQKNLCSALWTVDGNLIAINNKYRSSLGLDTDAPINKLSFAKPKALMFPRINEANKHKQVFAIEILKKIDETRQLAVNLEIPINAIMVHPFTSVAGYSRIINQLPLFHPQTHKVIAIQTTLIDFKLFGLEDFIPKFAGKTKPLAIKYADKLAIPLSKRQHEILYLLATGFSQREIAHMLNISRSTVVNTCINSLYKKFNTNQDDMPSLISKARKIGVDKAIPTSLCKPLVVILGQEHGAKVLNSKQTVTPELSEASHDLFIAGFYKNIDNNFHSILWGVNGKIILATNKFAQLFGFKSWEDIRDLTFKELFIKSSLLQKAQTLDINYANSILSEIAQFRELVISSQHVKTAIIIHPFANLFNSPVLMHQYPVFDINGQLIAIRVDLDKFDKTLGIYDYITSFNKRIQQINVVKDSSKLIVPLTTQQHEIIFLLAQGVSQINVAEILNISRGAVAKTCADINKKLGSTSSSAKELIQKATQLGLHQFIPASLCKPRLIALT